MVIIKYGIFFVLALLGIGQTIAYFRLKKYWASLPVVAATVTESRLLHNNIGGSTTYEAIIKFKYRYQGKDFESDKPALKSVQVFPLYEYESELLDKYKEGEMYNARVLPNAPELAYLEVAPLSKVSIILVPLITLGYLAYITGLSMFLFSI